MCTHNTTTISGLLSILDGADTGNLGTGGNCVLTITFNKAYGAAPKSVVITPKSSTAPAAEAYVSATSATTFEVTFSASVGTSITDSFYYWVVE